MSTTEGHHERPPVAQAHEMSGEVWQGLRELASDAGALQDMLCDLRNESTAAAADLARFAPVPAGWEPIHNFPGCYALESDIWVDFIDAGWETSSYHIEHVCIATDPSFIRAWFHERATRGREAVVYGGEEGAA